ncbi:MAG: ABC transporter substrate-binding protein [Blastochloris sp.]|nr:ABC transporter substrate-binding protein [Blastochloris sp.]
MRISTPSLRRLATILDRTPQAETAIKQFQDRYAAYQKASPKTAGTVLKLGYMDSGQFYVSTVDDPICRMLAQVASCAWEKATPDEFWGYETSLEGVLKLDPDVIILNNWSESSRRDMLTALGDDPLWSELRAVQSGRVLGAEGYENPIASSLPAAQKFLDTYMPLIYPDVFPTALTDEQVQEILQTTSAAPSTVGGFPMTIMDGEGKTLTFEKALSASCACTAVAWKCWPHWRLSRLP